MSSVLSIFKDKTGIIDPYYSMNNINYNIIKILIDNYFKISHKLFLKHKDIVNICFLKLNNNFFRFI